jgi:hypothetical protein
LPETLWGDAAEVRERGFVAQPMRVVAGGDQQDGGGVDTDAVEGQQAGGGGAHEHRELVVETVSGGLEIEHPSAQG